MKINGKYEALAQIARRGMLLAALLAMVLSVATVTRAQSTAASAPAQTAKPVAAPETPVQTLAAIAKPAAALAKSSSLREEKSPAKGAKEGIVVHGHWTIDVKNHDGTPASHLDFENTLNSSEGADLLTGVLSGEYIPLGFTITLFNFSAGTSTGLCGNTGACLLGDSRSPVGTCAGLGAEIPGNPCGGILTYTPNKGGIANNAAGYTLIGTVPNISNGGTITEVFSGMEACVPSQNLQQSGTIGGAVGLGAVTNASSSILFDQSITTGPSCILNTSASADLVRFLNLTGTGITLPAVTAGQSIAVTVVITFSGS